MKNENRTSALGLAKILGISKARGTEAVMKAQLISAILKTIKEKNFTHSQLAERSALPRSAVTGILSGSLQRVTLDRILRLAEAAGLEAELKIRPSA